MSDHGDATPCTVCGEPCLWGSRHSDCGRAVMAREKCVTCGRKRHEHVEGHVFAAPPSPSDDTEQG